MQGRMHHRRVEMARRSSRDRSGDDAGGASADWRRGRSPDRRRARPAARVARQQPRRGFEHGRLAGAGRSHEVDRQHAARAEVLAVVRRRPIVAGENPLVHVHRHDARDRRIHRNRTSRHLHFDPIEHDFVARDERCRQCRSAGTAAGRRGRMSPPHARMPSARARLDLERGVLANRPLAKRLVRRGQQLDLHTRELADAHRQTVDGGGAAGARFAGRRVRSGPERSSIRASALTSRTAGPASRRSCRALPRTRRHRRCGQAVELAIEVHVESGHPRRLVDQPLGNGKRLRRTGRHGGCATCVTSAVERLDWKHIG